MLTRLGVLTAATVLAAMAVPRATFPHRAALHADANDQRTSAGRMVDGELRVELDVVDLTWSPRGPQGPLVPAVGFAERGHAPQVPGPLLRMRAGTPVRVSVRNTLARAVRVRGLSNRLPGDTAVNGLPGFTRQPALRLAPGEEREVRFTPTRAVTSFYFARRLPNGTDTLPENQFNSSPAGSPEGGLVGAFIVDPAETPPPANERVFVITSYASPLEPGNVTFRLSLNGLSWPHTERLTYSQGDTVHWRVINVSRVYHPMHLHGFYFTVDSRGDTQADTTINGPRPLEVTEGMRDISTMQLSWIADRPGNWLFHCHLIRHSTDIQKYSAESLAVASTRDMPGDHGMGGLILGITIRPRTALATTPPANARRLDLWTGLRPHVFDDSAGYGFVLQRGSRPPAPDSIVVPGSPLILERGEPTRIVVHNRLPFPLGVHWHGLELESYYDGVGHWSGQPGNTRGAIPPADTMSVYITPPRSGTFMYHTHGEAGARLAQGLYGTLIVLDRGHELNPDTERLFVLASRGATLDADAAINGRGLQPAQHFSVGRTYRLRFTHISLDDVKNVRLLLNGKPVMWRPFARDGATLPAANRVETEATQRMDVGQTYDFEWTPPAPGVYVLEVGTDYYPARGTSALQRIAFGAGPVTEADLRVAATGTSLALGEPSSAALVKLVGAYVSSTTSPSPDLVSVWSDSVGGLAMSQTAGGVESPAHCLIPLADGSFVPGTCANGLVKEAVPLEHLRFEGPGVVTGTGASARSFQRVPGLKLSDSALARFVGHYEFGFSIELRDGVLTLMDSGRPGEPPGRDTTVGTPLTVLSPSRLIGRDGPFPDMFEFTFKDDKVVAFSVPGFRFTAKRLDQSAPDLPWMNASLPPARRATLLIRAMTLPEKLEQMVGTPGVVPELPQCYGTRHVNGIPRLRIPTLRITNGPVGVGENDCMWVDTSNAPPGTPGSRQSAKATALPSGMAVAASFDTAVARRFGDVIGTEARDLALHVLEGPGVNLARVPQAGRNFEYFGEDPYLTGTMAVAEIRAIQSHGVIAMAKHFVANEQETNRFTVDETVDDRVLHELYLLPFEMAVKDGHVAAIMCSYNMVNGVYACEDRRHLTDILRTAWGFTGYVQSDFTALRSTAGSLLAGADHDMPGTVVNNGLRSGPYYAAPKLQAALATHEISEANIDTALVRRYREMFQLGIFDRPIVLVPIDSVRDGAIAESIGEQSAVLLKNTAGILPLDPTTLRSLAIIGRSAVNPAREYAAHAIAGCCGGSSDVIPLYTVTPLDGMRRTLASLGSHATTSLTLVTDDASLADAVAAARSSDVAVVFAGTIADEGRDRSSISLGPPSGQDSLIEAVAAANPRTIVVLEDNASALVPWIDRVPAVLEAWFPGEETGDIVARLLLGAATPSGRLPVTFPVREGDLPAHGPQQWPGVDSTGTAAPVDRPNNARTHVQYSEGLEIGYRWFDAQRIAPRFPFGFGLSYTSFTVRAVSVTPKRTTAAQPIVVELTVTNTGRRRGAEVPQVYVGMPAGLGEPPKRLVGFAKVWLDPGETRRVRIAIDPTATNHPLGHWASAAQQWEIANGSYDVMVGTSADEIVWHGTIDVRR